MKKVIAAILVLGSVLYLATIGIMPDLIPFIDEALVFVVLINSLAMLGIDLRRFVGMKGGRSPREMSGAKGRKNSRGNQAFRQVKGKTADAPIDID